MGRRLNYGKRFRSGAVSVGHRYDEQVHSGATPPFKMLHMSDEARFWQGVKGANKVSADNAVTYLGKTAKLDERYEAEKRLVERINQAIDVMLFGLYELMMTPTGSNSRPTLFSQHALIDQIDRLCKLIGRPVPEYNIARAPGVAHVRHCRSCNADLLSTEKIFCHACSQENAEYKRFKLLRAQAERTERRIETLENQRTITMMQKKLKQIQGAIDARYRRYSEQDAASVETGRREQD